MLNCHEGEKGSFFFVDGEKKQEERLPQVVTSSLSFHRHGNLSEEPQEVPSELVQKNLHRGWQKSRSALLCRRISKQLSLKTASHGAVV
jgi:hypothetical protein